MRAIRFVLFPLLGLSFAACPGEEPTSDAGVLEDAGVTRQDAGPEFFASDDPILSKTLFVGEGLATGIGQSLAGTLDTDVRALGIEAAVVTGLAEGSDAGLLAYSTTKAVRVDVIYDVSARTLTAGEAATTLGALGEAGALPTALHDLGGGSFTLVATAIRGEGLQYDLTFRQVAAPFDGLSAALDTLSSEGFAVSAASIGESISLIGARLRGGGILYENRAAEGSRDPDAGLPGPGSTVSAFGPMGFTVTSVLLRDDAVFAIAARRSGEMPSRINTPSFVSFVSANNESAQLGFDGLSLFDLESIDGGYLMLGVR